MSKDTPTVNTDKILEIIRENKNSERFTRLNSDKKSTDVYSAIDNNIDVFKRLKDR